jgi:hypothetical protein
MLALLLPPFVEQAIFIAGLVLVTTALIMRLARRRGKSMPITPVEHLERIRQAKGMRGDLEALMVEIEQMAKRLGAQLDVKAMRLEKLVQQADERIRVLEQMKASGPLADDLRDALREALTAEPGQPGSSQPAIDPGPPSDPLALNVYKLADAGHTSIEIARQLHEHVGKVELILALRQSA